MTADPKALENIKENQKAIDKITALKKTVVSFGEKSKQISSAFREHFRTKLDPSKITDKDKVSNDADAAVKRLQAELKKQVQEELMESKRRFRVDSSRGLKRIRKTI